MMYRLERRTEIQTDPHDLVRRHRPAPLDLCGQRGAAEIVHPHASTTLVFSDSMYGYDPGVPHARQRSGFAQERGLVIPSADHPFPWLQELERHLSLERGIPCAPNLASRTGANGLQQSEVSPAWELAYSGRESLGSVIGGSQLQLTVEGGDPRNVPERPQALRLGPVS
jgi:hypothetical protein